MKTSNLNPEFERDDPTWYPLAEFSLNDVPPKGFATADLKPGSPFWLVRELGLPQEYLNRIEGTIAETVRGARRSLSHGSPGISVRICLFYNRKAAESVLQSGHPVNGGWGYYVIERSGDFLNAPCQDPQRVVELYIYKEVE